MDCRGHGKTVPLGDPQFLKFNWLTDDITNLLDYLNLPKVVIGGISMGAGVALNFAVRYPERTRALILSRVSWLTEPLPPNLTVFPKIAGLIHEHGAHRAQELFASTAEYAICRDYRQSNKRTKACRGCTTRNSPVHRRNRLQIVSQLADFFEP